MARANRHYIPGFIWHITHRCHRKEFLLKFYKDRARWLHWLVEARRRYGLAVLNYIVTSNHIHLLVSDQKGAGVIPSSIQLVAGRTAQEYNSRKKRPGAFWQDRYHATAIESGEHLRHCMVYIDLNMVRAGVVAHPFEWAFSGYSEIQNPRRKNKIIAYAELQHLLGFEHYDQLKVAHKHWVAQALKEGTGAREPQWSESIAVGTEEFVDKTKTKLGIRAAGRKVIETKEQFELREPVLSYKTDFGPKNAIIGPQNTLFWNVYQ
jgi:REP element-mobilizing transposase RayT